MHVRLLMAMLKTTMVQLGMKFSNSQQNPLDHIEVNDKDRILRRSTLKKARSMNMEIITNMSRISMNNNNMKNSKKFS